MEFILELLMVWRLSHLIAREDGPFNAILNVKKRMKFKGFWFELTKCVKCLSVWFGFATAIVFAPHLMDVRSIVLRGFALSGAAILLEINLGGN